MMRALRAALSEPGTSRESLLALRQTADALDRYLTGADWKRDYADDEAGLFPAEMRRGVLSQDGLYDLLEDYRDRLKDI